MSSLRHPYGHIIRPHDDLTTAHFGVWPVDQLTTRNRAQVAIIAGTTAAGAGVGALVGGKVLMGAIVGAGAGVALAAGGLFLGAMMVQDIRRKLFPPSTLPGAAVVVR